MTSEEPQMTYYQIYYEKEPLVFNRLVNRPIDPNETSHTSWIIGAVIACAAILCIFAVINHAEKNTTAISNPPALPYYSTIMR